MRYQKIFQCLKGVGFIDLSNIVIPIQGSNYCLFPVNCSSNNVKDSVIVALTDGRNENFNSFLSAFFATTERTRNWLVNDVALDNSRIIFTIRELGCNKIYGYAGLAFGDELAKYIEVDSIVRIGRQKIPGVMRSAVLELVRWTLEDLNFKEVWVRVLSDNPAITFYQNCGFINQKFSDLYESSDESNNFISLTTERKDKNSSMSGKKLVHMRYANQKILSSNVNVDYGGTQNRSLLFFSF